MFFRNLTVAAIEHDIVWSNPAANLEALRRHLDNLPDGTDLIVLPELFTTGVITGDKQSAAAVAERNSGDTVTTLHRIAAERHIAFAGTFLAATASQLYNRAFFIESNGDDVFYDKRHIFAPGGEDKVFNAGKQNAPVIRYRGVNIKMITCYDLRFPVFCRNRDNEYDLLLVMANWPVSRQRVWTTLLAARAIENECYVCGVNRCGASPDGLDYGAGSTLLLDYKGNIVARTGAGAPLAAARFSLDALRDFRDKFPAWRDADPFTLN